MGLLISLPWVQSLAVSFLMSAHPYLWNRVKAHFSSTLKFWNWRDKICKYFWASFLTSLGNKLWVLQSHVFCCDYCICAWRTHIRSNIQNLPNISSLREMVLALMKVQIKQRHSLDSLHTFRHLRLTLSWALFGVFIILTDIQRFLKFFLHISTFYRTPWKT